MNRRDFLYSTGAVSAALAFPLGKLKGRPFARSAAAPDSDWRSFEVTTHVEVLKPLGTTRIWVPAALVRETPYQRTLANTFAAPGGTEMLPLQDVVTPFMSGQMSLADALQTREKQAQEVMDRYLTKSKTITP